MIGEESGPGGTIVYEAIRPSRAIETEACTGWVLLTTAPSPST